MRHLALLPIILMWGSAPPAGLAQPADPFSTIEITASGGVASVAAPLADYWRQGPMPGLRVETPFYAGHVIGQVQVARVSPLAGLDVPAFVSMQISGGWGIPVPLPLGIRLMPAFRTGIYTMHFDDPEAPSSVANETELTLGLEARASVPLGGGWYAGGSVSAVRVFTHHPIEMMIVEVGISRRFVTPGWLRRVLE